MSLGGGAMRRREFIALVGGAAVTATRRVCAAARAARSIIGLRKKWRKDLRGGHVTCVYFRNVCCCNCSNRYRDRGFGSGKNISTM